ncbi:disease resistance protein PIK6-NP-like [Triticum dicoccoides]|uniref:disease resistance protein PIK6-NP-like n=1 Tax=Triticum dicoccoides TaxID=85692 RepID=UPI001891B242|nr:disease resistance protein PIK6-NP-like [Triticum dicoccoides]
MDAQGALDSLLGRLTTILADEARLLGGLHSDVQFIKDEMGSMNGLLLHLTGADHRDHHVRAWMKQVVGLTRDCEGNIELYIHNVAGAGHHGGGFLGYLRHIVRYVRTIPERHRIATRIQELKVRARDVGDRKLRYGVTVPPAADQDDAIFMDDAYKHQGQEEEENDAWRRFHLVYYPEDEETYLQKIIDDNIKSVLPEEEPVEELTSEESKPRIFLMMFSQCDLADKSNFLHSSITEGLYKQKMGSFSCKALVSVCTNGDFKSLAVILGEILDQVEAEKSTETSPGDNVKDEAMQLTKKLEGYLKGKRFLIIMQGVNSTDKWNSIRSAVLRATAHGSPGSIIVIITSTYDLVRESPYEIVEPQGLLDYWCGKTRMHFGEIILSYQALQHYVSTVAALCRHDRFAMKMIQHLLYVYPLRSVPQLENIIATLRDCQKSNKNLGKHMLRLSYNKLPSKYRRCFLYLTIFPKGDRIRRTTVCRRWITEGLITSRENHADYEAYCCFDVLFLSGFIQPGEISDMGKIKTFTLHPIVHESITRIAKDLNFVDTVLPSDLTRHLPIHSRTRVQASHVDHSVQAADGSGIVAFLPYLAKSSQWQLMKMLDLEGCRGLKKEHLKSICKIILLKYLSLRNTDITELPKQIEKLQGLETLDIRQTAVQSFPTKSIMLPMLKRLLAGQGNNSDRFQESFTAMRLPSGVRGMKKLEILSRVVSDNADDSIDVGHLLRLRKLGVILSGKKGGLGLLFQQIEKLHGCLCSLSIQINQPPKVEDTLGAEEVTTLVSPPKLLQSLNISGIASGLLLWIAELDQLTKLTLSETYLTENYMRILGKLAALRCLRLRRNSYAGNGLKFKEGEFKSLKSLVVDGDIITNITFDTEAAPKLTTIVWSFAKMESISGLGGLWWLKRLELNGDCNPGPVRRALGKHPNDPEFKHNPRHGHQEDGAVVAASPP